MADNSPRNTCATVDGDGRVVLPAEVRERLGIEPGDQVVVRAERGVIHIQKLDQVIREAQAYFASLGPADVLLSEELIRERRAEAAKEDAE